MLSRYVVEHECGVHVLAAGDEFGRPGPREADAVEQTLRALNAIYDYVILDVGTSLVMPAPAALQLSDHILLVANPDVPCLRNLQRLIDAVKTAGVPGYGGGGHLEDSLSKLPPPPPAPKHAELEAPELDEVPA